MKKALLILIIFGAGFYIYNNYHALDVYKKEDLPTVVQSLKEAITPGALKVATSLRDASPIELSKSGVISLTNKARKENGGLVGLKENSKLDKSAKIKLDDMFAKQYFEHVSPSGVGVSNLGDKVSYQYIVIGENLAMGNFGSDAELVDAWMKSPGHRANILNKRYTEIGVAVGRGVYEGRSVWMAVQHFGAPTSVCPVIDEALHQLILKNENALQSMSLELAERKKKIESGGESNEEKNTQIDQFNSLVADYNNLAVKVRSDVAAYNKQVQDFNTCAANDGSTE